MPTLVTPLSVLGFSVSNLGWVILYLAGHIETRASTIKKLNKLLTDHSQYPYWPCPGGSYKNGSGSEGTPTYKNGSGHAGNKSLGMPPGNQTLKTAGGRVGFPSCL